MKYVFGVILIFLLYAGTNYYIGRRIFQGLRFLFPHVNAKVYALTYIIIAVSIIGGFLPLPSGVRGVVSWIGSYWMGIFVYLLMLFLAADLVITLGRLANLVPSPIPQSVRFYAGLFVLLLSAALAGYGMYNANQIKQVSYDIKINKTTLPDTLKIVLVSDLHLGAVNSEKRLEKIIEGINELEPDIVCLAGDIFNGDYKALCDPERVANLFKELKSSYGVYACLGNHDGGETFKDMVRLLERSNITILNDEHVVVGERLVLIGRVDPFPIGGYGGLKRKDIAEILASINTDLPVVVMDHNSMYIEEYGKEIDLVLSGHTHKGQIFPINFITDAIYTVDYGHYQKDVGRPHVIVTSGVGTWGMPMRVGTNCEIVSIDLH